MGRIQNEIVSTAQQIGMSTLAAPLALEKSNAMLRKAEESRVLAASDKAQNEAVKKAKQSDTGLTEDDVPYIKANAAEPYREQIIFVADKWWRRLHGTAMPSQAARDNAEVVKAHRNVFTGDRAKLDDIKKKMKQRKDMLRVRDAMFRRKKGGKANGGKDDR